MAEPEMYDNETSTQQNRYLTFSVCNEIYGIGIHYVREIVGIQKIISIPDCPKHMKGIINLRGSIIPVIDMRVRFQKEAIAYNDRTCIIVIKMENTTAGLIVDNVAEVATIDSADIVKPPKLSPGEEYHYIEGIGKTENSIKLLLDCKKLITQDETDQAGLENVPVPICS